LKKAEQESKEFARNIQDVLIYALYPTTGARFLKYKYGVDRTIPDDWKPPYAPGILKEGNRGSKLVNPVQAGKSKTD
jgi:pyruvate carboxylase subunit B